MALLSAYLHPVERLLGEHIDQRVAVDVNNGAGLMRELVADHRLNLRAHGFFERFFGHIMRRRQSNNGRPRTLREPCS